MTAMSPGPVVTDVDRWERSPEVLWRRTATGTVVLPNDSSAASCLEGLHAALWLALARPMSIDVLVDHLTEHLDDDPAARRRVVAEAIRFLVALGAVRENYDR